jgi:hypothetical protein
VNTDIAEPANLVTAATRTPSVPTAQCPWLDRRSLLPRTQGVSPLLNQRIWQSSTCTHLTTSWPDGGERSSHGRYSISGAGTEKPTDRAQRKHRTTLWRTQSTLSLLNQWVGCSGNTKQPTHQVAVDTGLSFESLETDPGQYMRQQSQYASTIVLAHHAKLNMIKKVVAS